MMAYTAGSFVVSPKYTSYKETTMTIVLRMFIWKNGFGAMSVLRIVCMLVSGRALLWMSVEIYIATHAP